MTRAGFAAQLLAFGEELRGEGVAIGTSELLDAFAALDEVPWTEREDFREALAATLAKSQEDRRVFDLVFDRFFFRAAEAEAVRPTDVREDGAESTARGAEPARPRRAARADRRGARATATSGAMRDLARLAIAAFGRQGEGSGVIGVDVQRIRRALGPARRAAARAAAPSDPRARGPAPRGDPRVRAPAAARARARP